MNPGRIRIRGMLGLGPIAQARDSAMFRGNRSCLPMREDRHDLADDG